VQLFEEQYFCGVYAASNIFAASGVYAASGIFAENGVYAKSSIFAESGIYAASYIFCEQLCRKQLFYNSRIIIEQIFAELIYTERRFIFSLKGTRGCQRASGPFFG
jgi:hypothetical protein